MNQASRQRVLAELGFELDGRNLHLPAILQVAAVRTTVVIGDGCVIRLAGSDGGSLNPDGSLSWC